MQTTHRFDIDSDNGDELIMICPEESCRRRVMISRSGRFTVIDQGAFFALHTGGGQALHVTATA